MRTVPDNVPAVTSVEALSARCRRASTTCRKLCRAQQPVEHGIGWRRVERQLPRASLPGLQLIVPGQAAGLQRLLKRLRQTLPPGAR
jgi:hypothetical protein